MKWISNLDKKFVVPILLGISLTTISCVSVAVLLYSMFGKDDETTDDNNKKYQIVTSRCLTVQYKVPKQYLPAILGRCGIVIRNIQRKTGTHISIKKTIKSPYIICYINGNEMEGIRLAESMIKNILDSQPKIETHEMFVPVNGSKNFNNSEIRYTTREIEKDCDVHFIIENGIHKTEDGKSQRKIIIKGTEDQIMRAISYMEDRLIQDVVGRRKYQEAGRSGTPRLFLATSDEEELENIDESEEDIETDDEERLYIPSCHSRIFDTYIKNIVLKKYLEESEKTLQQMKEHFKPVEIIEHIDPESREINGAIIRGNFEPVIKVMKEIAYFGHGRHRLKENKTEIPLNDDLTATNKNDRITPTVEPSSNDGINTVNISINTSETFVSQDEVIGVFVSAVKTPEKFWIHVIGPGITALDKLVSEMTEYYDKAENRELHLVKTVKPDQIVAAKFHYDNKWYRGKVLSVENSQCKVFYVDYGDVETISINDVLELRTDMLCLRLQAIQCSLGNIKPRENEWTPEACDKFNDLTHVAQWKPLIAKIKGYKYPMPIPDSDLSDRSYSPIPYIELYEKNGDKNIDIRETLIRLELAKFEEEVSLINAKLLQEKYDIQSISSSLMAQNDSDIHDKGDSSICTNN